MVKTHCVACHEGTTAESDVDLAAALEDLSVYTPDRMELWERALRKVRTRQMPRWASRVRRLRSMPNSKVRSQICWTGGQIVIRLRAGRKPCGG